MAKIKPGTYNVKQEMVCDDQGCVLRTTIVTGRHRGTVVDSSPVQTPGLSEEEILEQSTLEHHRSTCINYLRAKVAPLDGVNSDYIDPFIHMYDSLNTTDWDHYFKDGPCDRAELYEDFLKFRNAREDIRIRDKK